MPGITNRTRQTMLTKRSIESRQLENLKPALGPGGAGGGAARARGRGGSFRIAAADARWQLPAAPQLG
jgi:hypothetical protein